MVEVFGGSAKLRLILNAACRLRAAADFCLLREIAVTKCAGLSLDKCRIPEQLQEICNSARLLLSAGLAVMPFHVQLDSESPQRFPTEWMITIVA